MSNVLKRVEIAYTILEIVKQFTNKEVSIQGGFARDLHYGRVPKDADIFIHMGEDDSCDFAGLNSLIFNVLQGKFGLVNSITMKAYGESTTDDFCDRHYGVLQLTFMHHNFSVDVIFTKPKNTEESLKTFDCNLNQFYITEEGLPKHLTGNLETLVFSDKPIRSCRKYKMTELAKEVGAKVL